MKTKPSTAPIRPIHIVFGGHNDENDYDLLQAAARTRKSEPWSCLKKAKAGDRVLVYCTAPHSAIVAAAHIRLDPKPGRYYDFETELKNVRMVEPPLTADEIRKMFPRWPWAKSTRGNAYVPPEIAEALWQRALDGGSSPDADPEAIPSGAGFGDPQTNRLVEMAAIEKATSLLESRGFKVSSRESEKVGYDLEAIKGRQVLHVEVKGISGNRLQFPITAGELRRAEDDTEFWLFAVTNARSSGWKVHEFSGAELRRHFRLDPLAYMASKM